MAKCREYVDDSGWLIFCPACQCGHKFDKGRWTFSGTLEKPTLAPSMLVKCSSWQNIQQDQWMPVMSKTKDVGHRVPFAMLSEDRAKKNHDQTLRRLAERGGMSAYEILCNLDDRGLWDSQATETDQASLTERVQAWLEKACPPSVCHSFVRDGRIEFLSDCTHPMAGQTVDLPDF